MVLTSLVCAQGASETNISFVVSMGNLKKSLNVIHDLFFCQIIKLQYIFSRTGTVGGSLLEQIHQQQSKLLEQNSVKLNVIGNN